MKSNILINFLSERGERLQRWLQGDGEWKELDEAVEKEYALNHFFSPYMQRCALAAASSEFMNSKSLLCLFDTYNIKYYLPLPDEHFPDAE